MASKVAVIDDISCIGNGIVTHTGIMGMRYYLIDSKGCVLRGKDSSLITQPDPHVTLWLHNVVILSRREMYITYVPHLIVESLTSVAMILPSEHAQIWRRRAALCRHRAARDSVVLSAKLPYVWLPLKQPRFFSFTDNFLRQSLVYISRKSWTCLEVYLRPTRTMAALPQWPATRQ
jgi:hypothetical protein